jgi:16S rRNA G966 N2-methylase RsmD
MHPTIARAAIGRFCPPGGSALDPFCGSGTVLVEALAGGRRGHGIDASPLAVAIARVRTTALGDGGRSRLVETAAAIAEAAGAQARKRVRPAIPPWAARERERFATHVALELLGLRERIMATPEDAVGWALRMSLSSLLVKFAKSGLEAPRDGASKRVGRGVPSSFFFRRVEELARGLEELERGTPPGTKAPQCQIGDARECADIVDASVDLVLTSPPYAGTYDYALHHGVRFLWLGLPERAFAAAQLGVRDRGLGTERRAWVQGRRAWLSQIGRVLAPGGHAVLVVGDGVVQDRPEDAAEVIHDAAAGSELVPVALASQEQTVWDRRLRDIFGGRPRREHILLLRRAGRAGGAGLSPGYVPGLRRADRAKHSGSRRDHASGRSRRS